MKVFPSFLFPSFLGALLALGATPGAFGAPSCLTPPSGLVGWWPGDGNANDIAGTNNGTLQGGATATAVGMVAQAFSFDGTNSFVQIPDSAALRPTNLTIETWVRFSSLDSAGLGGSPAGDQYIVFKQNTRSSDFEGFDLSKTRVAGGDVFRFLVTSATAQTAQIDSATLLTTGVWYHVAAVRGSNFTQLYVNGQLERQTNVAFAQNYGSLPLYFGTSGQAYWDHKFKGALDEVSLYNRALSSNEVAAIYGAGAAGKCKAVSGLTITTQPQSQGVAVGGNAVFTVAASGTPPLSYQWQFGGAAIPGATNTALPLANAQPANAGNYAVIVTNAAASVTSAVAVLTVLVPPAITTQPQSLTVVAGTTATLSAAASGSTPLSYQWRQNSVNLSNAGRVSGATGATLTITSVQSSDAGSYTLVVSNAAGAGTSTPAILTVTGPAVITAQPASQSVNAGASASFSVTASGTSPLSYQWLFNGAPLSDGGQFLGTASPVLSIGNAQTANAGGYSVVVANAIGSATSTLASLTVVVPGSCLPAPAGLVGWWPGDGNANDITGTNNGTLQGGATATVAGEVGQAFGFDGTNSYVQIPDSATLRPTNLTIEAWVRFTSLDSAASGGSPAGDQYIVFKQNTRSSDFEGFDLSKTRVAGGDVFRFLVTSATAQTAQIDSATLLTTGVWYHVAAVRGSNFTQLYVNGQLERQTNVAFAQDYGTLPLYFGTSGQAYWDHKLKGALDEVSLYNRALSSNEVAAIYAAGAAGKCKVLSGVTITVQPQSQTVATGSNVLFTVTAGGTAPLSYQWQFNGAAMAGAINPNLTLTNAQPTAAGNYAVIVTNAAASVASAVAVLTVLAPPAITTQPQSLTSAAGTTASFSATATGSAPLSYQWWLNGVNLANGGRISGATTTTLTISGVQAADAGSYALAVSNGAGLVTSAVAVLTVTGPPAILTQPVSQSVAAGANATFSVSASGTAPLSYQWQFNSGGLSGATSTSLTLAGVQPANAGSYTVVVTNSGGSATSAAAVLTVTPASVWETADIGAVWSDNFSRSSLGPNWIILGGANASIVTNQLQFVHANTDTSRQVYYQPWLTSSDQWTLRWSQRFGTLDAGSVGVGVGLKNFQAAGGDDRGYNALLYGAGANLGKMALERWDGATQNLVTTGPALTLAAGDIVDCWLTRSGWTITATASNRANAQVSTTSLVFSDFVSPQLEAPTISRTCFYPFQGTVYVSNLSFAINHRKPARFIVIGASIAEGYDALTYAGGFVRVMQSNVTEAVCNDSSSWNSTGDSVSLLPEILAHQPGTAILTIGANDLTFGYPASQWQGNYANLVAQLQANGVKVKHCLPTPETPTDQRALKTWISANYPASDVIDDWTSLVTNGYQLNPAYDNYDNDGVHPNDAGHLIIAQIILSNVVGSVSSSVASAMVVVPPRFTSVTLLPNRTLLVSFNAASSLTYRIDASADMVNWTTLTNLPNQNGTVQFIDTDAINFTQRFYRATVLP